MHYSGTIWVHFVLTDSTLTILIMGRPPILPKKKKDGFYLEIRNKGAKTGTIIIRDTEEAMMQAVRQYQATKDIVILGEHRNGKKVETPAKKAKVKAS